MDKFFAALVVMIFSVLIFSSVSMFENQSSASTFKQGVEVLLDHDKNNRQPAIVSNKGN